MNLKTTLESPNCTLLSTTLKILIYLASPIISQPRLLNRFIYLCVRSHIEHQTQFWQPNSEPPGYTRSAHLVTSLWSKQGGSSESLLSLLMIHHSQSSCTIGKLCLQSPQCLHFLRKWHIPWSPPSYISLVLPLAPIYFYHKDLIEATYPCQINLCTLWDVWCLEICICYLLLARPGQQWYPLTSMGVPIGTPSTSVPFLECMDKFLSFIATK